MTKCVSLLLFAGSCSLSFRFSLLPSPTLKGIENTEYQQKQQQQHLPEHKLESTATRVHVAATTVEPIVLFHFLLLLLRSS